jgi:hypothetical protein
MPTIKLTGISAGRIKRIGTDDEAIVDGSLTIGDTDTDSIVVNAEFDSHLVPDDTNTYDIGEANKRWRKGYFDEIIAKLPHVNTAKYTESAAVQRYVRWDAAGSNGQPGVNNKFVAPANGQLVSVRIRATNISNVTAIAFHKASNGTADLNTTATESVNVNMTSANTTYEAGFLNSSFVAGDILGISLTPAAGFGNVNITCVWMLDWGV